MANRATPSYEAEIVLAYLASLTDETGRYLNDERMTESHKEMLGRWAKWQAVSLDKVDAFLTRYGVMTWELEMWAEEHYGRNGFLPHAERHNSAWLPTVLS